MTQIINYGTIDSNWHLPVLELIPDIEELSTISDDIQIHIIPSDLKDEYNGWF